MSQSAPHYLGLCAIAKDETPFLREWVAYHNLIGFERIFIYDNDSSVPVRDVLPDMYDAGIVDTYTIPGETRQLIAYNHCLREHGAECRWMAFFDLDEFLCLNPGDDARALLSNYEEYGALAVNFLGFSSSGHLSRPEGLVAERYLESLGSEPTVKCIVRVDRVEMPITPHHFLYKPGYYAVNADKIPTRGGHAPVPLHPVRLHHYSFRSQQDYEEKIRRGDAVFADNPRHLDKFYQQAKWPVTRCEHMLPHIPGIKTILETGSGNPYYAVDSNAIQTEPYALALTRLATAMEMGNPGLARLIFSLTHKRFQTKSAYLGLGARACLAFGDNNRAKQAAMDLVACNPDFGAFALLFQACLACGEKMQAGELARFLMQTHDWRIDAGLLVEIREAVVANRLLPETE